MLSSASLGMRCHGLLSLPYVLQADAQEGREPRHRGEAGEGEGGKSAGHCKALYQQGRGVISNN